MFIAGRATNENGRGPALCFFKDQRFSAENGKNEISNGHSEHANARCDVSVKETPLAHCVYAKVFSFLCTSLINIINESSDTETTRSAVASCHQLALFTEQTETSTVPVLSTRARNSIAIFPVRLTAPGTRMKLIRYTERGSSSLRRDDRYTLSNSLVEELIARDVQYQP